MIINDTLNLLLRMETHVKNILKVPVFIYFGVKQISIEAVAIFLLNFIDWS